MGSMDLYYSSTSPFARKVQVVLMEKGIPFYGIDVRSSGRNSSERNPLGKVPTLVLDDGLVLFDSTVITETLEGLFPAPPLMPRDVMARAKVRRWEALADGISDVLIPIVVEGQRATELQNKAHVEKLSKKVVASLDYLTTQIEARSDAQYLHGDTFSLADIAVISTLGYVRLRRSEFLEGREVILSYEARMLERPSLKATIPPNLPIMA
jgi:glutathione S-transferase